MVINKCIGFSCNTRRSIYGFVLKWVPVWWGLIGLGFGFGLGIIIKLIFLKKHLNKNKSIKEPEVVIIIKCKETLVEMVVNTLWSNHALGVSKINHING